MGYAGLCDGFLDTQQSSQGVDSNTLVADCCARVCVVLGV